MFPLSTFLRRRGRGGVIKLCDSLFAPLCLLSRFPPFMKTMTHKICESIARWLRYIGNGTVDRRVSFYIFLFYNLPLLCNFMSVHPWAFCHRICPSGWLGKEMQLLKFSKHPRTHGNTATSGGTHKDKSFSCAFAVQINYDKTWKISTFPSFFISDLTFWMEKLYNVYIKTEIYKDRNACAASS